MTYGDFKDFPRNTASDKVSRDKALNVAKNPQTMVVIKEVLLQWFISFSIHHPIIKKIEKRKVHLLN